MATEYQTRQRQRILDFLLDNCSHHMTADEIAAALRVKGENVGKSTIYRYLEKLVDEGRVRKFFLEGDSACYQYITDAACQEHFHLKCVGCGKLIHLKCDYLSQLEKHIYQEHQFVIHSGRTVFYGLCASCQKNSIEGRA